MAMNALFNWSGGKDSSLALFQILREKDYAVKYLLTSVNKQFQRVSMHGVRIELLKQQAKSLDLPLYILEVPEMPTMEAYNEAMKAALMKFKQEDIHYSIFGDIFLEDLKEYREGQLAKVGMTGVFPIWKRPTRELVTEFIDQGFKAVTVCVHEKFLDRSFVGRDIDGQFIRDLPQNVDPCGENGEFHSFVYDGPIFQQPVKIKIGEVVHKKYERPRQTVKKDDCYASHDHGVYDDGFWYCDLLPE
ncbi:MAG: diphthine--ammonia ligase [Candidatus Omnitrophota bacterium]